MSTSLPPDSSPPLTDSSPPILIDQPLTYQALVCPCKIVKGDNGVYGDQIYVAARDIKAGELISHSVPDIVYSGPFADGPDEIVKQIKALSPEKRRTFDSLKPYIPPSIRGHQLKVALGNKFLDRCTKSGYKPEQACWYHLDTFFQPSCRPNCTDWVENAPESLWTIAMHDIAKGSPLTKNRCPTPWPYAMRQEILKNVFEFDCRCEKCSLSPAERALSDSRLILLRQFIGQAFSPIEFIRMGKEQIRLYDEEGLYHKKGWIAFKALEACISFGDLENSKLWMKTYLELDIVGTGIWSSRYRMVKALRGDPTLHKDWRKENPGDGTMILEGPF